MTVLTFKYKNYKGVVRDRTVDVQSLDFIYHPPGSEFGYQPGWFITGTDVEKQEVRSFALTHIILEGQSKTLLARFMLR